MIHPDYKCCKYCKSLNVTIIEPSDKQYCVKHRSYVRKLDVCDSFRFEEDRVEFWKKADLRLFEEDYDESRDLTRHYAKDIEENKV